MKIENTYMVSISKEEKKAIMNTIDVLEALFSEISTTPTTSTEVYDILLAINCQNENVRIDDKQVILKYEF